MIKMFECAKDSAVAAVSSLLLEVSANPKPGNVDRFHDFHDLRFEHFILSSSSSFPIFVEIAEGKKSFGEGVLSLIENSLRWHKAKNVHFGAFLLLTPLTASWGDVNAAKEFIRKADFKDSLQIKKAFDLSDARVMEAEEMSLKRDVEDEIIESRISVLEWMKMAPKENFIAKEIVNGFKLSLKGKDRIFEYYSEREELNYAIVLTYIKFLSELLDPLIIAKKGRLYAEKVRQLAKNSLKLFEETDNIVIFHELDKKIMDMGVNPGSVADLTASSIYLALSEGWRC